MKIINGICRLCLQLFFLIIISYSLYSQNKEALIIDHTCTDITSIPQSAIENAISNLHIAYAHTSHGSQITSAMLSNRLGAFANAGGNGINFPQDLLLWDDANTEGTLDLRDYIPWGDRGTLVTDGANDLGNPSSTQWALDTRTYLDNPDNSEINLIMWAWCGQLSLSGAHSSSWNGWDTWDSTHHRFNLFDTISYDISEGSDLINLLEEIGANVGLYLLQMSELEEDYPNVKFVYMTGHLDGTGLDGILNKHNEIIREYCNTYGKILYDFADIESYDPDGTYYGDLYLTDGCNYDANGNGITEEDGDPGNPLNEDRNWALEWQDSHTQFDSYLDTNNDGVIDQQPQADWFYCGSSHTYPLNANLKAYAAWWLWARLAGWDIDTSEIQYPEVDTIIYILICENDSIFLNNSWQKTSGLYTDTLIATNGADSIIHTHLSVNAISRSTINITICEGQSYFASGANQTTTGTYFDTLENSLGCDSIVTTNLYINTVSASTIDTTICEGQSYYAGGANQTFTGIYYDTLINSAGCDSIVTINLTVNSVSTSTVNIEICEGESYFAGGINQTTPGTYYDTLENLTGCDSIIITKLIVNACADIINIEKDGNIIIYPNPTSSDIIIESNINNLIKFELYDLAGMKVFEQMLHPDLHRKKVKFGNIHQGLYICIIYDINKQFYYHSIIKKDY